MQTLDPARMVGNVSRTGSSLSKRKLPPSGPLAPILRTLIRHGSLRVIDWRGNTETYGDGTGPGSAIRIHDRLTALRLLLNPQFEAGEAYMEGRLTVEEGTLNDFLDLLFRSIGLRPLGYPPLSGVTERLRYLGRRLRQFNHVSRAQRNVEQHYDLSDTLYDLFLEGDRQYSCGYFASGDETLEECQALKKRHLAAKLLLRPGHTVLDIGSGWGGLGLTLAKDFGAEVTGLTLSREQHDYSNRRAQNEGAADHVRFKMLDYRLETGCYDRIVSVGMFEHVGVNHYGEFFRKVAELLKSDGVALLHSIGRPDGPGHTNPWIARHIFPGGYAPALSEVLPAIEQAGLLVTDIEILRLHYAETLKLWRERFEARREEIRSLYDERFCRMWEFYLSTSELSFRHQGMMVFQIQMARSPGAVPITRDYITRFEAEHPLPAEGIRPTTSP